MGLGDLELRIAIPNFVGMRLLGSAIVLAACTTGGTPPAPRPDAGEELAPDAGHDAFVPRPPRIAIEPAELVATAGLDEAVTGRFTVVLFDSNGDRTELDPAMVAFQIDDSRIGWIDEAGEFQSGPRSAGIAQLTATYMALRANAAIEITRNGVVTAGGATMADATLFETTVTDEAAQANVVYPLDGVMMPQDVYPATIQWMRGAPGDVFRMRFRGTHLSVDVLYRDGTPATRAWLVDSPLWRLLAHGTDPISLTVDRYESSSSRAIEGASLAMQFAPGVLRGSIYYWEVSSNTIQRIKHGEPDRQLFAGGSAGGGCIGCHTITPDGRTIAARVGAADNYGAFFDTAVIPAPSRRDASAYWYFSSFSPSGERLIVDTAGMSLELVDAATGAYVPSASSTLPRSRSANPAWAPSGDRIAYVANIDRNYRPGFDSYQDGDLAILPVTGPDTFGAPTVVVEASVLESPTLAPYRCINQPTWAPDSNLLVFAAGPYSNTSWPNALYATRIGESSATPPVRLDRAMGGPARVYEDVPRSGCAFPPTTMSCCHDVYHGAWSTDDSVCVMSETDVDGSPRFSPFHQGGYFWLVFTSRREYGNDVVGSPRGGFGSGRPSSNAQLWIAAIDPSREFDPSFAPYWLPGQDVNGSNIDAQWATTACRSTGESCDVDGDCCSDVCSAAGVCTPPPPDACRLAGETCSESADCCEGLACVGRLCSPPFI
jgi:hypothetical protein